MRFVLIVLLLFLAGADSYASSVYLCVAQDGNQVVLRADARRIILTFIDEASKPSFEGKFDKNFRVATGTALVRYVDTGAFSRLGPTEYFASKSFLRDEPKGTLRIQINGRMVLTENFACTRR
jgi:hypothetical protein